MTQDSLLMSKWIRKRENKSQSLTACLMTLDDLPGLEPGSSRRRYRDTRTKRHLEKGNAPSKIHRSICPKIREFLSEVV